MNEEENVKEEMTVEECIEKLKRTQADFENYRRRTEIEKKESMSNANAQLITQLLEVLDNFELALKHTNDPGVKLVYSQFLKILERQGLKVIDTKGKFDPQFHEVLIKVEGDKPGVILEEIKKGYMLKDKLIRASKIKLSTTKENK